MRDQQTTVKQMHNDTRAIVTMQLSLAHATQTRYGRIEHRIELHVRKQEALEARNVMNTPVKILLAFQQCPRGFVFCDPLTSLQYTHEPTKNVTKPKISIDRNRFWSSQLLSDLPSKVASEGTAAVLPGVIMSIRVVVHPTTKLPPTPRQTLYHRR